MVNIQHGSLRAFEKHGLAFVERVINQLCRIADIGFDLFTEGQRSIDLVREIDLRSVSALRDAILLRHHTRSLFAEKGGIQQINNAKPAAGHLVFVGRSNSTRCRANLVRATSGFCRHIELTMIGKDQVCAVADVQPPFHVDSCLSEGFNFRHQRRRVNDNPSADDGVLLWSQDAARDELKDVAIFADDNRVPGIMATSNAYDVIKRPGKIVDNLALALVAPLRAHHHDRFHARYPLSRPRRVDSEELETTGQKSMEQNPCDTPISNRTMGRMRTQASPWSGAGQFDEPA